MTARLVCLIACVVVLAGCGSGSSPQVPTIQAARTFELANFQPAVLDHYTLWNADQLYFTPKRAGQGR